MTCKLELKDEIHLTRGVLCGIKLRILHSSYFECTFQESALEILEVPDSNEGREVRTSWQQGSSSLKALCYETL